MSSRMRRSLIAGVVGVLLLGFAGFAYADTQSPLQGVDAGQATVETAIASLVDALNGDNRPIDANGLESEFPNPGPLDGPAGGLVKNGPLN